MVCAIANHLSEVRIAIQHWHARTIAIQEAFVWTDNVPVWKDSKEQRAVLVRMSVQMNARATVPVKLDGAFVIHRGPVKDAPPTHPVRVRTIVRRVVFVTMGNAFVNRV